MPTRPASASSLSLHLTDEISLERSPHPPCALSYAGRRRELGDEEWIVGSSPHADVVVEGASVSRRHFRLHLVEGRWHVTDLESRNGTFVDGRRVLDAEVAPGSVIHAGHSELQLVPAAPQEERFVARSLAMRRTVAEVRRKARRSWPLVLLGESGAGKDVLARLAHRASPRSEGPFVAINAGALPENLVESELFGHVRGAFTGASREHRGVFAQAEGGTLFLDEVGELPLSVQARLLRVLDTWRVRPVGGEAAIPVDVRLVCATHRDLRGMVRSGDFRQDLFYRIHRLPVRVPALRERRDDVEPLAEHFLSGAASELGARRLSPTALEALRRHPWPGNVRELRNVVLAAAAMSDGATLDAASIASAIAASSLEPRDDIETLRETVRLHDGNLSRAAAALGMARSTLRGRLKRELGPDLRAARGQESPTTDAVKAGRR